MSVRDDRLLAPTRWLAIAVIPVLSAAFVILYLLTEDMDRLWGWMVCPDMSAFVMGGGYLAGAYYFLRTARAFEWHRVGVGFVAVTVFSSVLMATTVLHWHRFDHGHPSFLLWLLLYATTPVLLPILWVKNRRSDPRRLSAVDVCMSRRLRVAVGSGGAVQLAVAAVMFFWPHLIRDVWPWGLEPLTSRTLSAFVAFPAVTWFLFLFDDRWSSFRVTQQVAIIGLALITVGAWRASGQFRSIGHYRIYLVTLAIAIVLNVALHVVMDVRAHKNRQHGGEACEPECAVEQFELVSC